MLQAVTWVVLPLRSKVVVVLFHEGSHKVQRDYLVSRQVCVTRCARLSIDVKCTICTQCFMPQETVYSNADYNNYLSSATKILDKKLDHLLDLITYNFPSFETIESETRFSWVLCAPGTQMSIMWVQILVLFQELCSLLVSQEKAEARCWWPWGVT